MSRLQHDKTTGESVRVLHHTVFCSCQETLQWWWRRVTVAVVIAQDEIFARGGVLGHLEGLIHVVEQLVGELRNQLNQPLAGSTYKNNYNYKLTTTVMVSMGIKNKDVLFLLLPRDKTVASEHSQITLDSVAW